MSWSDTVFTCQFHLLDNVERRATVSWSTSCVQRDSAHVWQQMCHLGGGGGREGHDGDPRQLLPNHAQPPVRWPKVMAPIHTMPACFHIHNKSPAT